MVIRDFVCVAGCKRQSAINLLEDGRHCFAHGRPWVFQKPARGLTLEKLKTVHEKWVDGPEIPLDELLEGL